MAYLSADDSLSKSETPIEIIISHTSARSDSKALNPFSKLAQMSKQLTRRSDSDSPIKPVFAICENCHDTNAALREARISQPAPKHQQKYELSLTLKALDGSSSLVDSIDMDNIYIHLIYIIIILLLLASMYLLARGRSKSSEEATETGTHQTASKETHPSPSSPPDAAINTHSPSQGLASSEKSMDSTGYAGDASSSESHIDQRLRVNTNFKPKGNPLSVDISSHSNASIASSSISKRSLLQKLSNEYNSPPLTAESMETFNSSDNYDSSTFSPEKLQQRRNRRYNKMSELIMKQAKKITTKEEFKNDLAFILFVCNIVETRILKKDNINKKELVIDTLMKLFAYNEEEFKVLERNIEFLHGNSLIKKDSIIKQMQSYWVKQKKG